MGNAQVNVDHSNFRTLDPGASSVNQAGATLKDIVESVNKVAAIVSDIANASADLT